MENRVHLKGFGGKAMRQSPQMPHRGYEPVLYAQIKIELWIHGSSCILNKFADQASLSLLQNHISALVDVYAWG